MMRLVLCFRPFSLILTSEFTCLMQRIFKERLDGYFTNIFRGLMIDKRQVSEQLFNCTLLFTDGQSLINANSTHLVFLTIAFSSISWWIFLLALYLFSTKMLKDFAFLSHWPALSSPKFGSIFFLHVLHVSEINAFSDYKIYTTQIMPLNFNVITASYINLRKWYSHWRHSTGSREILF